ncbi:NB-ARC domains-containing protein [Tanacetum coccineum]
MDHLFHDFNQKGIHAFRDDNELPKGEEISSHLYKAIEESRFLIVIFSKNYASSSWCVRELVKILECKQIESPKHEVRMIFYNAKPDVVRKQKRSFAEAFTNHEVSNKTEVDKWRKPLSMAANLCGWDLEDMTNGGIGMTTLAKPIYNLMYVHFEGSCFCEGVKEVEEKQSLTQVQMQMIGKILKTDDLKISSVGVGSMVIKQRMACKPILLVLDDVDHRDQLKALAGSTSWFCPGSLIIFTGRDKQLLRSHRVDEIHDMDFQNKYQSLQLFSFYAFEKKYPSTRFQGLADKAVKYVQGHPLALIVLDTNIQVLVDKSLITISRDNLLQMHDLIQAMAREIVSEESNSPGNRSRLWDNSSEIYDILSEKKATQAVEILDIQQKKSSQKFDIDGAAFAQMKNLRILKLSKDDAVNFSGRLEFLSNKLRLLYCLTTTPDVSEITNLEELDLEGCVNLSTLHPSIGMLKKLVVLNLKDCTQVRSFPSKVEIDSLQVLNLSGCLKVDKLSDDLGKIKSLTELHADRTTITKLPSFVSSLINLESLSFGGQRRIQPRWWTSVTAPFGLLSKQHQPQRLVSLAGLHMLKKLNLSYCNLVQIPESIGGLSCLKNLNLEGNNLLEVPESIGGLSCLEYLFLKGNNFTSLPGSLSQLSHLQYLYVDGCKKLEVLPELPPSVEDLYASDCTSLREVSGSSKDPFRKMFNIFRNCPKLYKNVTIDSKGSMLKTRCLDSSITSQGFIHQLSAFLGNFGFETNICEFFRSPVGASDFLDILYHGNSIPEWFTNRSMKNQVKVELPSDWCYDKNFRGSATCVKEVIGIHESYMIWLRYKRKTREWKEAKNFVTFSLEENNEDVEVKEFGARLICDEDIQQEAHISMLQGLPIPTQHGGGLSLFGMIGSLHWSW